MGILNVTPDSFSDGGRFEYLDAAVEQALLLQDDGADILDVGGESTRPQAEPVDVATEKARVLPVIKAIAAVARVPISIDTTKAEVAEAAIEAGASIVNDISGLTFDSRMIDVCRDLQPGIVCMHIQGTPRTMQQNPSYRDVVSEIRDWLATRLDRLDAAGIDLQSVILDPGIGFGKTSAHNLELLRNVQSFRGLNRPILIGHSRKRFLGKLLGRELDERLMGTVGVSVGLAAQQVDVIRVHDVAANRDAMTAFLAICPYGAGIAAADRIGPATA